LKAMGQFLQITVWFYWKRSRKI